MTLDASLMNSTSRYIRPAAWDRDCRCAIGHPDWLARRARRARHWRDAVGQDLGRDDADNQGLLRQAETASRRRRCLSRLKAVSMQATTTQSARAL